jgi:hypothetical protein
MGLSNEPRAMSRRCWPRRLGLAGSALIPSLLLWACASVGPPPLPSLRLIGTHVAAGQPASFGGISGLDRDPRSGHWYLLSDDRSARAPARFYLATLPVAENAVGPLRLLRDIPLRLPGGEARVPPDPEALRLDPCSDALVWSSEGDRTAGVSPSIQRATRDGEPLSAMPLPAGFEVQPQAERGPRDNRSLEGLAYMPGGASLWVAMEAPLYEDGPLPSLQAGAPVRITRLSRDGRVEAQYAYELEPVPTPAEGGRGRTDNGVSEILAIDADTLWVVERAGREVADGVFRFSARLYEARRADATDLAQQPSLRGGGYRPMHKRLLLDLGFAVPGGVDNIEAMAWGPRLPNGNPTLVLASDDNFSVHQRTQFLAFEVIGAPAAGSSGCTASSKNTP